MGTEFRPRVRSAVPPGCLPHGVSAPWGTPSPHLCTERLGHPAPKQPQQMPDAGGQTPTPTPAGPGNSPFPAAVKGHFCHVSPLPRHKAASLLPRFCTRCGGTGETAVSPTPATKQALSSPMASLRCPECPGGWPASGAKSECLGGGCSGGVPPGGGGSPDTGDSGPGHVWSCQGRGGKPQQPGSLERSPSRAGKAGGQGQPEAHSPENEGTTRGKVRW